MKDIKSFISDNKYTIIGHIVFITLLLFAIIYDKERTFIVDNSYMLHYIINCKNCAISFDRYSMAFANLLPLMLVWTDAPLNMVILGYSISFILLGYIIFILVVHVMKNKVAGIVITSVVLVEYHIFFFAVSETVQMIYFCALLIAWLHIGPKQDKLSNIFYHITLIGITFLCVNIHPSAIFPIAFIIGYRFIDNNLKIDKKIAIVSIAFVVFEILKSFTYTSDYESKYFDYNILLQSIPNFIDLLTNFIEYTFFRVPILYLIPFLISIVCIIFYLKKRQYIKFIFITCFDITFLIANIFIYSPEGYGFGTFERMFVSIIIFTMLPFANDVLPCLNRKQETIFVGMFSLSLLFSFIGINHVSNVYTTRLQEMEKVIKVAHTENKHKLFIKHTLTTEKLLSVWGYDDLPYVSALLSALDGPEKTVTLRVSKLERSTL